MGKTDVATTILKHHVEWAERGSKMESTGRGQGVSWLSEEAAQEEALEAGVGFQQSGKGQRRGHNRWVLGLKGGATAGGC